MNNIQSPLPIYQVKTLETVKTTPLNEAYQGGAAAVLPSNPGTVLPAMERMYPSQPPAFWDK